jgi:hypothetical protein
LSQIFLKYGILFIYQPEEYSQCTTLCDIKDLIEKSVLSQSEEVRQPLLQKAFTLGAAGRDYYLCPSINSLISQQTW